MKTLKLLASLLLFITACQQVSDAPDDASGDGNVSESQPVLVQEAVNQQTIRLAFKDEQPALIDSDQPMEFQVEVPVTGRYEVRVLASSDEEASVWVEDYIHNEDDRTYNVTGSMTVSGVQPVVVNVVGSPLQAGRHDMKLHVEGKGISLQWIELELVAAHEETEQMFRQNMDGEGWTLVWSDEFDGQGIPDTSKWSYNLGNWGWGNNELQYYTVAEPENARLENGHLIIEAHQNDQNGGWTSARLTTQGKESFLYGKIEFRAKVPPGRGTWAAGWLLGDEYRDEVSWPYCGEIDVLECVGFEIDDATGDGINHATCHTRAYYFKQGNQIGSEINVENMDGEFHDYAVEWYPNEIKATLDGEHYFTYDKNANELEWPFDKPQNIIVNLAVGGGWGGAQGVDESIQSHRYILDYVRVYEKQ